MIAPKSVNDSSPPVTHRRLPFMQLFRNQDISRRIELELFLHGDFSLRSYAIYPTEFVADESGIGAPKGGGSFLGRGLLRL